MPNTQTANNLAAFIWSIADLLRGDFKQSQYGRIILPFTLLRRLECVLEPTKAAVVAQHEKVKAMNLPEEGVEKLLLRAAGLSFFNTSPMNLSKMGQGDIEDNLDNYVQSFSRDAREIFEHFKFDEFAGSLAEATLSRDTRLPRLAFSSCRIVKRMSSRYKAYPEYKDSGVEWLGEAPSHWKTVAVGRLFSRTKRTGYSEKELLSVYRDYGVIPKSSRDDNNNKPSEDLSPYQLVEPNDLVMNKMKAWQGSIAISEYEGIVSPAYFVYQPNAKLFEVAHPKYIHYLLRNPMYVTQYLSRSKGIRVNQWDLDPDEFKLIELLLPSIDEQAQIFAFLDHETAKIDTMIEEQQSLIRLLKEKRQAVISHAVTKGLNPDVPMKDFGVEWLGEVPEHWEVAQLKYYTTNMQTGPFGSQLHAEDYVDDGIPLINPAHIVDGKIVPESKSSVDENTCQRLVRHKLEAEEIIFARRGELGRCAIVQPENAGWLCGTGSLRASLADKLLPEYAYLLIISDGVKAELSLESKGSTMDNLNTETLGCVRLPVPPENEQKQIIEYEADGAAKYGGLLDQAQQQVAFLKERRTALISAAVTGKIDVRDWAANKGIKQ